jgi:hypothetical protein
MPYRMGRGDYMPGYYRGDPGFFSFIGHALGSVAKIAGGAVLGTLTGGPLAGIAGAVKATVGEVASGGRREVLAAGGSESALTPAIIARHRAALARGPIATRGAIAATSSAEGAPGQSGYHQAKDGSGRWVRNRSMNPYNPRALRRASRRAHSFLRGVRSMVRYYTPKAPKGKAYVAFRRRKK